MKEFGGMMHESKKPEEIINFFKNQPMEFVSGTNWNYNNSGYFLLGYIIEKISGKTYPQYIKENFFTPLGMTNSYDGSDKNVISNQPTAYQVNEGKVEIAEVINMTLPCATGSLLSTAEDLFKWHQALHTYKVVKKENLQKAFTEYKLANGVGTGYGYGWFLDNIQGSPTVEHGGDINGFLTNAIYLPKQDVFVAVFSNNSFKSTDIVSAKIAALTIGNPYNYKEITLNNHVLQDYAGIYKNEDGEQRIITLENKQLYSQRNNWEKFKIKSFQKDTFFFDDSLTILAFQRNMVGKIESVLSNERMGKTMMWKKIQ